MARTALTIQQIVKAGLQPTYGAANASGGNSFLNDGNVLVYFKNTGTQKTVTIQTPAKVNGLDVEDPTITVPATTGEMISPLFPPGVFNQADGTVNLDFSDVTGLTLAALHL